MPGSTPADLREKSDRLKVFAWGARPVAEEAVLENFGCYQASSSELRAPSATRRTSRDHPDSSPCKLHELFTLAVEAHALQPAASCSLLPQQGSISVYDIFSPRRRCRQCRIGVIVSAPVCEGQFSLRCRGGATAQIRMQLWVHAHVRRLC